MDIPSPILIFGDIYLGRSSLISTKQKYPDIPWYTLSLTKDTMDEIRTEVGSSSFFEDKKIVVLQDWPNRKETRDFLIDIASTCPETTNLILFDSNKRIKVDPKTKTFGKEWGAFVKKFKKIEGCKVVNNGESYTEKDTDDCSTFIKKCFNRHGIEIHPPEISMLMNIVGYDRGMLTSEIEKLSLTCGSGITTPFILENAFPVAKDAVIYQFGNELEKASYEKAIRCLEVFLHEYKINENVLADIILKKARWQLIAAYYWSRGATWNQVIDKLMEMGQFPALAFHGNSHKSSEKKEIKTLFKDVPSRQKFLEKKQGIPEHCFNKADEKTKTKAETLTFKFFASQIVAFLRDKVAHSYSHDEKVKQKVLNRAEQVYLFCFDKLCEIRYGKNPYEDICEMIRMFVTVDLKRFE